MAHQCEDFILTERDEVVVLGLPDGSSIELPQATIRRSAVLREAMNAGDTATNVSIALPQGVLQDWLQSVNALNAAATTSTGHATDIARNPRILRFLKVR